jgi:membrane fusion protein (multidrug efflux system)
LQNLLQTTLGHAAISRSHFVRNTMLGVVTIAVALASGCKKKEVPPPPPPEVYVVPVVQRDVPVYLDLVGQTQGFQDVEIRARVEGFLDSMDFEEGSFVKKGELLYRIDPKPLQATVAEAQAEVATAQARLEKASNDVARYTPLVAKQAVSQQELDNARSSRDAGRSEVAAAKAAVDQAKLKLGYTRIVAPIAGLVGTTKVKPGNLVGRGEPTLLTTISQIDPILFVVGVSEQDYLRIARRTPGQTSAAARTGIELTLTDGTVYPYKGRLGTVERAVNPATGTLGVQLIFPNPQQILRPGVYGRVRVLIDEDKNALLVPQRAVQEQQNLYRVAVVNPDNTVAFRSVQVGPRVDTLWVIKEGLKPGEQVVTEGLQSISDGMAVRTTPMAEQPVATGGREPAPEKAK